MAARENRTRLRSGIAVARTATPQLKGLQLLEMRDLNEVFAALRASPFRRRFRLRGRELVYLKAKGRPVILAHAADFIAKRLAPAQPRNDGKQTPYRGHPVFIAQHATGTCCRTCLQNLHQIPKGAELTAEQQDHAVRAIERWLTEQEALTVRSGYQE